MPKCPRCQKEVDFAEKVTSLGKDWHRPCLKCEKCHAEVIKGGVVYENAPWHRECFICKHCSKQLAGEIITTHEDNLFCAECYGDLFPKKCCKCFKPITGETKYISYEDRHWHSYCFVCTKCEMSLVGRDFLVNVDSLVCPNPECSKNEVKVE